MIPPDIFRRLCRSISQWARSTKKPDVSTGPLACPFAHSLAPLTRSLTPHYLLGSCASLTRSLPHSLCFNPSLTPSLVNDWMAIYSVFFFIQAHSSISIFVTASIIFILASSRHFDAAVFKHQMRIYGRLFAGARGGRKRNSSTAPLCCESRDMAPLMQKPAPLREKPAPLNENLAPLKEKPAPLMQKPAPLNEKPAPLK